MEQLIRDLNSPQNQGRPDAINQIQRQIQRLQREPAAWQTSLDLLNSNERLLQFYGALTLGLKVNADWEKDGIGQDRNQVSQLLEHLVTSYVMLISVADSEVVVMKLSSVLAAVFGKPDAAWAHPCRHVFACALTGHYIPQNEVPALSTILDAQANATAAMLNAVLRLGAALQEELGANCKDQIGHKTEVRLSNNASDVWQLIEFTLSKFWIRADVIQGVSGSNGLQIAAADIHFVKIAAEALQQMPAWSKYVAPEMSPSQRLTSLFTQSAELAIQLLERPEVCEYCMPCLTSMQADHSRLLAQAVPDYLRRINDSGAARSWLTEMQQGGFSSQAGSYVEFLEAVISNLDATTDGYLTKPDIPEILERIQALTICKGAAVVEDEICTTVLEMMTTIAEGYSDWSEPSQFDQPMTTLIRDVCVATLAKVQYPADELDRGTATWEEDDYTRFEDYRFQASDFFQTAIGILGADLAEDVARSLSLPAVNPEIQWSEFEAALFVLTAVSDALSNEPERCDPSLNEVFSSQLWNQAISATVQVPGRVRRSVIRLLSETTSYLQRNPQHLISSLDFLFRSLQVKSHSNHAAKAIYNLCDSQRSFLVQGLPQFLQTITSLDNIPLHSRGRVLSGVAALVQALPSEADKVEVLGKLLQLIQNLQTPTTNDNIGEDEEESDPLFERLFMLAALAKGLQSPADVPIDLEGPQDDQASFWTNGVSNAIQQTVLQMLAEPWAHMLDADKSDLVTTGCDFLKAGFKEQHPSPLKFPPTVSTNLLCSLIDLNNPNLDQTMNTASCFVSSTLTPSANDSSAADTLISRVLAITTEATELLNDPIQNPNFSAPTSILDFIIRTLPKYGLHVFTHTSATSILDTIINYSVILLRSKIDTLPRRSAAAFFTSFLDLSDSSSVISTNAIAATVFSQTLDKYCPTVLGLTVHLLAGECARSEIESLGQLLRAFIAKQPLRAKKILQEAIKPESGVLTAKALEATKPEQRSRFVAQVDALRGQRRTNDIVREFWIACKGGQFGYVT